MLLGQSLLEYLFLGLARLVGILDVAERYATSWFARGNGDEHPVILDSTTAVAVSLCTQIWMPGFFAKQRDLGATLLVNLSSDAVFNGSRVYAAQRIAMLKVRAVENRRWLLHAANASPSLLITPEGAIAATVEAPTPLSFAVELLTIPVRN